MGRNTDPDRHHILTPGKEWELRPESEYLRQHPSLVARIGRVAHSNLHAEVPCVPLLPYNILVKTARDYQSESCPLKSVESLMRTIEVSTALTHPHDIEQEMAQLTMRALDLQRPFIADGLKFTEIYDMKKQRKNER